MRILILHWLPFLAWAKNCHGIFASENLESSFRLNLKIMRCTIIFEAPFIFRFFQNFGAKTSNYAKLKAM